MDKTVTLIVVSMVLMVTGLTITFMFTGSIEDLQKDSDNLENQGCQFQADQLNEDNVDRIKPECIEHVDDSDLRDRAIAETAGVPIED